MPNETCRLLSNGYKFDFQEGRMSLQPCCHYRESIEIDMHQVNHTAIKEKRMMWNSRNSYKDQFRCSNCNFDEKKQLRKTFREMSFSLVPDHAELGDAYYLELQLDKTCNGGCIICHPGNSSFWQSELDQFQPNVKKSTKNAVDVILDIIDISTTRRIAFLGGEPFLIDTDEQLLPNVPDPSVVSLQYTTNGSVFPSQRRQDLWKEYHSVSINFSIDGIGDRFNYLRYPLNWDKVWSNMQRMRDTFPENITFKMNHTANVLNLYYYDEFEKWYHENFSRDRFGREIIYRFSSATGLLRPHQISADYHKLLQQKYPPNNRAINVIRDTSGTVPGALDYLDKTDARRGLDWKTVFPDIKHVLSDE